MYLIKKIMILLKKIFNKKNRIEMIETPAENLKNNDRNDFTKLLKVDLVPKYEKKKVEIPTCFGDGLGIQTKISY